MTIKTLSDFQKNISRTFIISLISICAVSLIIIAVVYKQYKNNQTLLYTQKVNANVDTYNANLAEKLSIIASAPMFIDYARSGSLTRKSKTDELLTQIKPILPSSIIGMTLLNLNRAPLLSFGEKSSEYLALKLCYLDNHLNATLGQCNYIWVLYLDKKNIVDELQKLNPDIFPCKNCALTDLVQNERFGNFHVAYKSTLKVNISIKEQGSSYFYLLGFIFICALITLAFWNRYRTAFLMRKFIALPIKNITEQLKGNTLSSIDAKQLEEIYYLSTQINQWKKEKEKAEENKKLIALSKLATQLAHDIRSPLVALDLSIKKIFQLPEGQRIIIRNAVARIHDIANNLLSAYKQKNIEINSMNSPELIADVLWSVTSEKRAQYAESSIEFMMKIEENTHDLFVNLPIIEFKRVLSNLINNAVEAITEEGIIFLELSKNENNKIVLKIRDTGRGIPTEFLAKVMQGGLSIGKQNGAGLGLANAINLINSWGGTLEIQSKVNEGTGIEIILTEATPPAWFASSISLFPNATIVVLDDDESIHDIWKKRLKMELQPEDNITFVEFYRPNELIEWYKQSLPENVFFLIDYEFLGEQLNGLQIIEQLNIAEHSRLVTSHYEEKSIRQRCEQLKLTMIPKNFAIHVPIHILRQKPDLIFIDDAIPLTDAWRIRGEEVGKKIITFNSVNAFKTVMSHYAFDIPIYIDSDLQDHISGQEFAKFLSTQGYMHLYLATGYDSHHFEQMDWITAVVGKKPPF